MFITQFVEKSTGLEHAFLWRAMVYNVIYSKLCCKTVFLLLGSKIKCHLKAMKTQCEHNMCPFMRKIKKRIIFSRVKYLKTLSFFQKQILASIFCLQYPGYECTYECSTTAFPPALSSWLKAFLTWISMSSLKGRWVQFSSERSVSNRYSFTNSCLI